MLLSGDVHKAQVWTDEESVWTECSVWLRDRFDHLQLEQQAVPVCQHGHGPHPAQVYGVQRTAWKSNEPRDHWGERRVKWGAVHVCNGAYVNTSLCNVFACVCFRQFKERSRKVEILTRPMKETRYVAMSKLVGSMSGNINGVSDHIIFMCSKSLTPVCNSCALLMSLLTSMCFSEFYLAHFVITLYKMAKSNSC